MISDIGGMPKYFEWFEIKKFEGGKAVLCM